MLKYAILNGAYRLAMSELRNPWIAVAEAAGMRGKRASGMIAAIALLVPGANVAAADAPPPAQLPVGGQVAAGQVAIASSGTRMDITQSSSSAVVNWDSFSVGSQAHVNFDQPSAAAVILNRVQGSDPSAIFGRISANGSVFLTNPSGILFAPGAQVDVGSLVASSLGISDANFLAGKYRFEKVGAGGTVVNQGNLNAASGGFVALIAPQVSNSGSIEATKGSVGLAAGDTVNLDFDHDGLLSFQVNVATAAARADNSGVLIADGGRVVMNVQARDALLSTVLNNDGVIRARSLESRNGEILLGGGNSGVVSVTGTLDASGVATGQAGGTAKVLGDKVGLFGQAKVDVSGVGAGGTALVGGNFQGEGPEQNASMTYVGKNVSINADAVGRGDGGKVIVWADESTRFYGNISARGGAQGGDGGFAEVSGKHSLVYEGLADLRASQGKTGNLLLDPDEIMIINDGSTANTSGITCADTGTSSCITPAGATSFADTATVPATGGTLTDSTLNAQLALGNTTVTTSVNDITSQSAVNITLGTSTLTLTSAAGINLGGTYDGTGGGALQLDFVTTLDLSGTTAGTNIPTFTAVTPTATGNNTTSTIKAAAGTWNLSALNTGGVAGLSFSGAANLTDTGAGIFNMGTAGSVTGTLTAVNGTVSYATRTGAASFALGGGASTGMGGWSGITTLTGSGNSDTVTGAGQTYNMTGANTGNNGTVSWTSVENLAGTGASVFNGGGGSSLSGNLSGASSTVSGVIQTGGTQIYSAGVVLRADTMLNGAGISFASTIKSDGTNRALTVADSGTTVFGGAVGSTVAGEKLSTLTINGGGTTTINGVAVTTIGNQTYTNAVNGAGLSFASGGGAIVATNAGNDFTGTLSASGTGIQISDANSLTVALTDGGNSVIQAGGAVTLGTSTVGGYLDVTAGGDITQVGALNVTGDLWAKSTAGNIALDSVMNSLGATVSLIAAKSFGVTGAGRDVSLWANSIRVGTTRPSVVDTDFGITAARVSIKAPTGGSIQADGLQGLITADQPLNLTPALTILANGVIGNPGTANPTTEGLRVHTSGLVKVVGDAVADGTVMLVGDDAVQPKYEFSGDPLHRSVKYNGAEATNAQLAGALDAAYLDIRNQTTEIRESGFAKENANKVLRRGVVTSAGPGQPAVDDSTGLASAELCDGDFIGQQLSCQ